MLPGIMVFLLAASVTAETDSTRKAREEVETELKKITGRTPEPKLTVEYAGVSEKGYVLEDAAFAVDGTAVKLPPAAQLRPGTAVFSSEVRNGKHELSVRLVYAADFGLFSYMTGYKFKLTQKVDFEAQRGLALTIRAGASVDPKVDDWKRRLSVSIDQRSQMLAAVDDSMPPLPPPRKVAAVVPNPAPPPAVEPPKDEAGGSALQTPDKQAREKKKPGKRPRKGAVLKTEAPDPAPAPLVAAAVLPPDAAVPETAGPDATQRVAVAPPSPDAGEAAPTPSSGIEPRYLLLAAGVLLAAGALGFFLKRRRA